MVVCFYKKPVMLVHCSTWKSIDRQLSTVHDHLIARGIEQIKRNELRITNHLAPQFDLKQVSIWQLIGHPVYSPEFNTQRFLVVTTIGLVNAHFSETLLWEYVHVVTYW